MIQRSSRDSESTTSLPPFSSQQLLQEMSIAFPFQSLLLITGERGTGKATLARKLHQARADREAKFQEINCRCEPQLLQHFLDQTLLRKQNSQVQRTTLLREFDALSLTEQLCLLKRVDQTTETDAGPERYILTTSIDIQQANIAGRLRDELYYRIKPFRFHLSPLWERRPEILSLTRQFVKFYADRYQKKIDRIDESLIHHLCEHRWPGNLRELQHVLERAVIYCPSEALTAEDLPLELRRTAQELSSDSTPQRQTAHDSAFEFPSVSLTKKEEDTLEERLAEAERHQIEKALQRNLQSRTRAARELGISRVTLYNKMKKLGLETHKPFSS